MSVLSCELRFQVTIQEPTETEDSTGQPVQTWATFATVYAKVDTTTEFGRDLEVQLGGSMNPRAYVLFTTRYVSGLTEKMRIVFNGDNYNIVGIADIDGRRAFHMIRAIRGLSDG